MASNGGFIAYSTTNGEVRVAVYTTFALAQADAVFINAAIAAQRPVVIDNALLNPNRGPFIAQYGLVVLSNAEAATTAAVVSGGSGGSGGASKNLVFNQSMPASIWSVTHNFGYNPSVTVTDESGTVIVADVSYLDLNTLTITFAVPTSGSAYLI